MYLKTDSKYGIYFKYYQQLLQLCRLLGNFKKTYILVFLFILCFSAFFEISILGFLYILIKAFMNPDYYTGNYYFKFLLKFLDANSNQQLISYLSFFFIVVCFISGLFRLFFVFIISRLVFFFGKNITILCYEKIIYQEYKFYFSNNINDVLSICAKMQIINSSIYNTILMIYNVVIFIFIFLILSYFNFFITISTTLFLFILYFFIIYFLKNKIIKNATIISEEQSVNLKIIRETFNGFRDILINNYQKLYSNLFTNSYSKLVEANENNRFIFSSPRPVIETFILASIGIVIFFYSDSYRSLEKLLPLIAVLAVASQRMLPVFNQLYAAFTANLEAAPSISYVYNFLKKPTACTREKKIKPMPFKKSIILKNIFFSYSPNDPTILNDINLKITHGSRIGLIGKSGTGKSTLADLILGVSNPNKGEIFVDGTSIAKKKQSWFAKVSSVPQNIFITDKTFSENIAFGTKKNKINLKKVKLAAEQAQISDFIEKKTTGYNAAIREKGLNISAGQKQRIAIARALYKDSSLIIFDEVTSSLDTEVEKLILKTIYGLSRSKYTLIIISHKLSNLKKCDHIYKIQNSKLSKFK
jgi:ATP-binding cassette subfamily B protein